MIEEAQKPQALQKDATLLLSTSWAVVIVPVLLLVLVIPYFLSSVVLFTHNPVDETIVDLLGVGAVKPSLIAVLLLGCVVGTVSSRFSLSLFHEVETSGCVLMKGSARWFRLFLPWLGLLPLPIFQLVTYLTPGSPWDWGALSAMFFTFPGFGFILTTSGVYLMTYLRVKSNAKRHGRKLQMVYTPRKRGSYQIRIINL